MLNFDFLKKVLEYFLHHILCMIFQEKCFSSYMLLADQISLPDCLYFLRDIGQYVYCDCLLSRMWKLTDFEINLIFIIKPFS